MRRKPALAGSLLPDYDAAVVAIAHMTLTAFVLGTATAVLGTGRVTIPLVLSTTLVWSFVPVLQLLTGLWLLSGYRGRRGAAIGSYFKTDVYWSLWILGFAAAAIAIPDFWSVVGYALLTCAVPIVLTARALVRLRLQLFRDRPNAATRRVVIHQALTHAMVVLYIGWAVALWPRLLPMVNR